MKTNFMFSFASSVAPCSTSLPFFQQKNHSKYPARRNMWICLLLCILTALSSCSSDDDTDTPDNPPSTDTSSPSLPIENLENLEWERVPLGAQALEKTAPVSRARSAITLKNGRIVAVGWGKKNEAWDGIVWVSDDQGLTWAGISHTQIKKSSAQAIEAITLAGEDRLVAVGIELQKDSSDPAVWLSDDNGKSWRSVTDKKLRTPGRDRMLAVTQTGERLVAVGWSQTGINRFAATSWLSDDNGENWERVLIPREEAGKNRQNAPTGEKIHQVTLVGDRLVAVGKKISSQGETPAIWLSDNSGKSWRGVPHTSIEDATPGLIPYTVTALANGTLIAAGTKHPDPKHRDKATPAIWISHNKGKTWQHPPTSENAFTTPGRQGILTLFPIGDNQLIAAGADFPANDPLDTIFPKSNTWNDKKTTGIWASKDSGNTWTQHRKKQSALTGRGLKQVFTLTRSANYLIALGMETFAQTHHLAIWRAQLHPTK